MCPRCNGRARVVAAIHEAPEARRFLNAVDQRSRPVPHPQITREGLHKKLRAFGIS